MSRISVCKVPGFKYPWWATWEGQLKPKVFPTWRDAMECADNKSRTVEVVLPRITADMEDGRADWPNLRDLSVWPDQHDEPRLGQPYLRIASDYQDVDVELHDFRPLACVLLAYAEQEGVK